MLAHCRGPTRRMPRPTDHWGNSRPWQLRPSSLPDRPIMRHPGHSSRWHGWCCAAYACAVPSRPGVHPSCESAVAPPSSHEGPSACADLLPLCTQPMLAAIDWHLRCKVLACLHRQSWHMQRVLAAVLWQKLEYAGVEKGAMHLRLRAAHLSSSGWLQAVCTASSACASQHCKAGKGRPDACLSAFAASPSQCLSTRNDSTGLTRCRWVFIRARRIMHPSVPYHMLADQQTAPEVPGGHESNQN